MTGCASTPPSPAATFVVVRHAEKVDDDTRDPVLNAAGRARADALALQLRNAPVTAVYATGYRRTQQTAAPLARMHGIEVRTYDAKAPAPVFAAQLRSEHRSGTVVVVGHSNTVPDIVAALCACAVAAIDESVYGGRYEVHLGSDGRAALTQGTY
jgi:broad specificity phosphatase PhoE